MEVSVFDLEGWAPIVFRATVAGGAPWGVEMRQSKTAGYGDP